MKNRVQEQNQDDFSATVKKLNHLTWKEGYDLIHAFCYTNTKLDLQLIQEIMELENKDFIDLFLREYILFDEEDKAYLETCINLNLNNSNTEYVSDLIYFANDLSLNLKYKEVIALINRYASDENYLVLAALVYVSNNIKYYYIEDIVSSFTKVVNSKDYFQSEQILASLTLYRITRKKHYLDLIAELIDYDKENLVFLTNLLGEESYQEAYFDLTEINRKIPQCRNGKKDISEGL
ncbi:hypothetical protein ACKUSY_03705 [Myroides odoratus]